MEVFENEAEKFPWLRARIDSILAYFGIYICIIIYINIICMYDCIYNIYIYIIRYIIYIYYVYMYVYTYIMETWIWVNHNDPTVTSLE